MKDETRAWLQSLSDKMWVAVRGKRDVGQFQTVEYMYHEVNQPLEADEWAEIQAVIASEGIPVQMTNSDFGFGIRILLLEEAEAPPYPGVPQDKPEVLLAVDQHHLPLEGRTVERNGRLSPMTRMTFDAAWSEFSPLTHAPENVRLITSLGLEAPKSKGYYDY